MTHQDTESSEGRTPEFRVSISPEPTDDELVAIMQALQFLDEESASYESSARESAWVEIGRRENLRSRNWSYQARSWAFGRQ